MHTSKELSTNNKQEKIQIDASSPVYYVHEYVGEKFTSEKCLPTWVQLEKQIINLKNTRNRLQIPLTNPHSCARK